ncbi:hypothetical protein BC830DRAFT_1128093 [Chytriomyces sp. MP71]|nr:hypothetical protein BC830DRAFT_1128093 [Chytriomyces sp. MP71]
MMEPDDDGLLVRRPTKSKTKAKAKARRKTPRTPPLGADELVAPSDTSAVVAPPVPQQLHAAQAAAVSATTQLPIIFNALRLRPEAMHPSAHHSHYPGLASEAHNAFAVAVSYPTLVERTPSHDTQAQLECDPSNGEASAPPLNSWNEVNGQAAALEVPILSPSAPSMELVMQDLEVTNRLAPTPLDDEVLGRMYVNAELQRVYDSVVADFRKNVKYLVVRDKFFESVLEYERSFSLVQSTTEHIARLKASIESLMQRVWTLKKSAQKLSSRCHDGVYLVHIVTSETATLNKEDMKELRKTLTVTLAELLHQKTTASFQTKMLKLWIQAHLDEHLNGMDLMLTQTEIIEAPQMDRLIHFLDVLFFFERRRDSADSLSGVNDFGINIESMPPALSDSTLFMRDIRGWISHIISFFLKIPASMCNMWNSHILLHILRCPGISAWGSWYIQWHPPTESKWTDKFLDSFLTDLHIFLNPIEELAEQQHVIDIEKKFVEESLKKLELTDDWIVVKEVEVAELDLVQSKLTLLSDEEYVIYFSQFNIEAMYYSFLQSSLELYKTDSGATSLTDKDMNMLRVFAITNFLFETLARGLFVFSSRQYTNILKEISKTVVNLVRMLEESVKLYFGNSQFNIALTVNSNVKTSVQAELDGSFVRAAAILLNRTRAGSWEYLTTLPCSLLSDYMKFLLVNAVLTGEVLNVSRLHLKQSLNQEPSVLLGDDIPSGICRLIESNSFEAKFLLSFLGRLCISGNDSGYQVRLKEIVAKVIFYFGFLNLDIRDELRSTACTLLATISSTLPSIMSLLVNWTRRSFSIMGHLSLSLFTALPLNHWCPSTTDFENFVAMLRDPNTSYKFSLAKAIIAGLNWGYKFNSGTDIFSSDLFIPRSFHRFLALSLCNLCLDRFTKGPIFSLSSALSTTTALSKGNIGALLSTTDTDFYDWCWEILINLSLYQPPTSPNTYSMESNIGLRSRPFEILESAQLATLKGAMQTKSLAAYVLLMISEVGYSPTLVFEREGWTMMQMLLNDGQVEAIIHIVNDVFLNFVTSDGLAITTNPPFLAFFTSFMKSSSKSHFLARLLMKHATWNPEAGPSGDWLLLWVRVAFADPDWTINRNCIQLLDSVCQIALLHDLWRPVCIEFKNEYIRLVSKYKKPSGYAMSIFNPVDSLKNAASTIGDYLSSYPTLVAGPSSLARYSASTETECLWFSFVALVAESQVEAEIRLEIGQSLSADSQLQVSSVVKNFLKPLELFSIYRWGFMIADSPMHPLLPLMIQVFFSLYFEKALNPIIQMNGCFGFRFLKENKGLLERMNQKFTQTKLTLMSAEAASKTFALYNAFDRDNLCQLLNASLKWLLEPHLLSSTLFIGKLDASYCLRELTSILHQSPAAMTNLWIEKLPIAALKVSILQASSPQHLIKSISPRSESPQLYVRETSLPGMPWVARQTIMTPTIRMDASQLTKILNEDLKVLILKARDADKVYQDYTKSDNEYLTKLELLYVNSIKCNGRYERKCSSACLGAAQFRFSYDEVQIKRDVKQALTANRSHFETLAEWDNIDSRVSLSALRVIRAVEWGSSDFEANATQNLNVQLVPFFFKLLALGQEVRRYPPITMVIRRAIQSIGPSFIATSNENTVRLFDIVTATNGGLEDAIIAFNPSVAIDKFADLYYTVSMRPTGNLTLKILQRFHIENWLENAPLDSHFQFLDTLISIFETSQSLELPAEQINLHKTNLELFLGFMARENSSRVVSAILVLVDKCLEGTIPTHVFLSLSNAVRGVSTFAVDEVLSHELAELELNRNQCALLIEGILAKLEVVHRQNADGIYGVDASLLDNAVEFMVLLLCSKPLYSMLSEMQRLENVTFFRRIFLLVLGVGPSSQADGIELKSSEGFAGISARLVSLMFSCMRKIFRVLALTESLTFELWTNFSQIISLKAPLSTSIVILTVFRGAPWSSFIATTSFTQEVWNLMDAGLIDVNIQVLLTHILSNCSWPSTAGFEVVQVCARLISAASTLLEDVEQRREFFSKLEPKLRLYLKSHPLTLEQLETLLHTFPVSWNEAVTNLDQVSSESPMGFCLKFLKDACTFHGAEGKKLFYGYVCKLLASQTGPDGDNFPMTFSIQHLEAIITSVMSQVDQTASDAGVLSHCLHNLFGVLNGVRAPYFTPVWNGVTASLKLSANPLVWISVSCTSIASLEVMPILLERAIDASTAHPMWESVIAALTPPELGMDLFVSNCLHHALPLTVYILALQTLLQHQARDPDRASVITGEQLSQWISKLNFSALLDMSREEKVIPLLDLFAQLLKREAETRPKIPAHQTRLHSLLPGVAESVLKWGEPANQGLWVTLGFGSSSGQGSAPFRVFCKGFAAFVGMRLFSEQAARRGEAEGLEFTEKQAKFVAQVTALSQRTEFAEWTTMIVEVEGILRDETIGATDLRLFITKVGGYFSDTVRDRRLYDI